MNFNEKLQNLRKQKGLTQEELAALLFVSRTAISKWESGRGYPNLNSLKEISNLFNISLDDLLSSNQLLLIAEEDKSIKSNLICDLIFGLLDFSFLIFLFFPIFRDNNLQINSVSLLNLENISQYLKIIFLIFTFLTISWGIVVLSLQNFRKKYWLSIKHNLSLCFNILGILLFIISFQPYAGVYTFLIFFIKFLIFIKTIRKVS